MNYSWDAANNLVNITFPDDKVIGYVYDSAGNRIKRISKNKKKI